MKATTKDLKDVHCCESDHSGQRELRCTTTFYDSFDKGVFRPSYDRTFVESGLIEGRPLLTKLLEKDHATSWSDLTTTAVNRIMETRQVSEAISPEVIRVDLSCPNDYNGNFIKKFHEKWIRFQQEDHDPLVSVAIPTVICRVPGTGVGSKKGRMISKILMGDGRNIVLEIMFPLELNLNRDNETFERYSQAKLPTRFAEYFHKPNFMVCGDDIITDIYDIWNYLSQLTGKVVEPPAILDSVETWIESGLWTAKDISGELINFYLTGAVVCQLDPVDEFASYHRSFENVPCVVKQFLLDKLVCVRNCSLGFLLILVPQLFPDTRQVIDKSGLSLKESLMIITSAIEQNFTFMPKFNSIIDIMRHEENWLKSECTPKGCLDEFHKMMLGKKTRYFDSRWGVISVKRASEDDTGESVKKPRQVLADEAYVDSLLEGSSDEEGTAKDKDDLDGNAGVINTDEFITLASMKEAYPELNQEQNMLSWIEKNQEQAVKLLQRSNKEGLNYGLPTFSFGKRKFAQFFQRVLTKLGHTANFIHSRKVTPAPAIVRTVKNI